MWVSRLAQTMVTVSGTVGTKGLVQDAANVQCAPAVAICACFQAVGCFSCPQQTIATNQANILTSKQKSKQTSKQASKQPAQPQPKSQKPKSNDKPERKCKKAGKRAHRQAGTQASKGGKQRRQAKEASKGCKQRMQAKILVFALLFAWSCFAKG